MSTKHVLQPGVIMVDQHPVLQAANEYGEKYAQDTGDGSLDYKSFIARRDDYLLIASAGIIQLLREMESTGTTSIYELSEAYALLLLMEKNIGGMTWSLTDYLLYSGVISSQRELELILARAKVDQALQEIKEIKAPSVPMIGIVGKICSGKGSIGTLLEKSYGSTHLPLSDRLREVSFALGGSEVFPRGELRKINDAMKPKHGNDVYVRWTIERAKRKTSNLGKKIASMDGFRSLEEAQTFKNEGGILIGVTAGQKTRFKRLLKRERAGDDSWEDFLESDRIESEWIEPIFSICDYTISNNDSQTVLMSKVATILQELNL